MMSFGGKLEIYAVPRKSAQSKNNIPISILNLSGVPLIAGPGNIELLIDRPPQENVAAVFRGRSDGLEHFDHCIRFSVIISRRLVSYYSDRLTRHFQSRGLDRRPPQHTRGVIFMGMLFRDFRNLVYLILILANIAEFKCFPVYRARAMRFGESMVIDRCSVHWAEGVNFGEIVSLKKLDLSELLQFTLAKRNEFEKTPSSSFMKGLAHLSYLYDGSPRFTLSNLTWCLATIETFLNPKGQSVRSQIEDRLRVLFSGGVQNTVLDEFKKVYEYRSKLIHGSLKIPFYLHDIDTEQMLDFPLREAEFALALATRLVQICFEEKIYDLKFDLNLRTNEG